VVDAYAQLAAEGYLRLRQGARPRVSNAAAVASETREAVTPSAPHARFDFRPSVPDVSTFPRAAWLRSLRQALATITDADLAYGDPPRGVEVLRSTLADYLGRVRGVVADPEHIVITNGYTQGLGLVCRALAAAGTKRIALDDPSNPAVSRSSTRSAPSRSAHPASAAAAGRSCMRRRRAGGAKEGGRDSDADARRRAKQDRVALLLDLHESRRRTVAGCGECDGRVGYRPSKTANAASILEWSPVALSSSMRPRMTARASVACAWAVTSSGLDGLNSSVNWGSQSWTLARPKPGNRSGWV
jgi:hypothetical protein